MKTLQECKDEVAKKYGYMTWKAFVSYEISKHATTSFWGFLDEAAELYASQFKSEQYDSELKSIIDEALSFGYHAAKDELKGIPSNGYGDKFYEKVKLPKPRIVPEKEEETQDELWASALDFLNGYYIPSDLTLDTIKSRFTITRKI
jgi:hypothetical protein